MRGHAVHRSQGPTHDIDGMVRQPPRTTFQVAPKYKIVCGSDGAYLSDCALADFERHRFQKFQTRNEGRRAFDARGGKLVTVNTPPSRQRSRTRGCIANNNSGEGLVKIAIPRLPKHVDMACTSSGALAPSATFVRTNHKGHIRCCS